MKKLLLIALAVAASVWILNPAVIDKIEREHGATKSEQDIVEVETVDLPQVQFID